MIKHAYIYHPTAAIVNVHFISQHHEWEVFCIRRTSLQHHETTLKLNLNRLVEQSEGTSLKQYSPEQETRLSSWIGHQKIS